MSHWLGNAFLVSILFVAPTSFAAEMAVTVDDLPTHGSMPNTMTRIEIAREIISALKKHSVPDVYGFINGAQLADAPEMSAILKMWVDAGFALGNHTYSHLDLERVSARDYIADIRRNEEPLKLFSAGKAFKYFRYPYLHEGMSAEKRHAVWNALAADHYTIAPASVYFGDWAWNEAYARCAAKKNDKQIDALKKSFLDYAKKQLEWAHAMAEAIYKRATTQILLVHIGAFDAVMMDDLMSLYEKSGAKFVTLRQSLKDQVYKEEMPVNTDSELSFWEQAEQAHPGHYPSGPKYPLQSLNQTCQ